MKKTGDTIKTLSAEKTVSKERLEQNSKITEIKGIGPRKALAFEKSSIKTIGDLLYFLPRTYQDRRTVTKIKDLKVGDDFLVKAKVITSQKSGFFGNGKKGKKQRLAVLVGDETGQLQLVFFNAQYLASSFNTGEEKFFFGRVTENVGRLQMVFPEFSGQQMGIVPVYSQIPGVSQNEIRKIQKNILDSIKDIEEGIPEYVFEGRNVCTLDYALRKCHFPETKEELKVAKYRLVFEELLILQLGLLMMKQTNYRGQKGASLLASHKEYIQNIGFELTEAQKKVSAEIVKDLEGSKAMNRLLQGDVGSGKTVVAEIGLYKAAKSGMQAAFMAPTEILAKQHFRTVKANLEPYRITVALLTSSLTKKEKETTLKALKEGKIDILIGTHAIIQDNVEFKNLGLVITDEQHRFGVTQRMALAAKGQNAASDAKGKGTVPNVLVMTATPIPRTLAVVLFGDLDISIIDQLPKHRQPIITTNYKSSTRLGPYKKLIEEIKKGRQGYIVAPFIEESETLNGKSAQEIYEEIKTSMGGLFNNIKTAIIYGSMPEEEKTKIMSAFYKGEIQVLVSTVVIEVGIDVPNATTMIIESAGRFGLSQLHQLRGRVGRGKEQSYCMLIYDEPISEMGEKRIEIITESTDGFYISEKDMELRGPGDVFGTRQHGIPSVYVANLIKHVKILEVTQKIALNILKKDQALSNEDNDCLKERVDKIFGDNTSFWGKI